MSANVLFIGEELLKSRTGISTAIDGKQIKPHIKIAQDMYIQPALGSTLYLRLQSGITASDLSDDESTLLNDYVTDCLIWYTMMELPFALGFQFFSKGVLQKTSEESNAPSRSDLELISNQYKATAEFYKRRMINYLKENYLLFYEYLNPGSGYDVIFPENKAYTCPIYLGGYDDSCGGGSYNNSLEMGTPITVYITPAAGLNTFNVTDLSDKTVIVATRSGMVKGVTTSPTTNSLYLQINNIVVTLPTGDLTQDGELFSFTYR